MHWVELNKLKGLSPFCTFISRWSLLNVSTICTRTGIKEQNRFTTSFVHRASIQPMTLLLTDSQATMKIKYLQFFLPRHLYFLQTKNCDANMSRSLTMIIDHFFFQVCLRWLGSKPMRFSYGKAVLNYIRTLNTIFKKRNRILV